MIPREVTVVIEPLNTVLDHPGNYLSGMAEAVDIVTEVDDARIGVLADFYHLEMMGKRTQEVISRHGANIGDVHIADVPGRHEPGTGTVGFEYEPAEDSDRSLDSVARLWKEALGILLS